MIIRNAEIADVATISQLHAEQISEGFLPTLGQPFLERLYRRILKGPDAFALVAAEEGSLLGFAAGAREIGALYKRFLIHDGVVAGLRAAPILIRSLPRVIETLRYPTGEGELPNAEILAVAVTTSAQGRGIGRALVSEATTRLELLGANDIKVVTGADNAAALALYRACGFTTRAHLAVHAGTTSEVLVWTAP